MKDHKARPILFSSMMVQAILEGRKVQTRRAVRIKDIAHNPGIFRYLGDSNSIDLPRPAIKYGEQSVYHGFTLNNSNATSWVDTCPYGQSGDILFVRETLYYDTCGDEWCYVAGNDPVPLEEYSAPILTSQSALKRGAIPSIHMPREACRLFIKITDVRVERLWDITPGDAGAEGVEYDNIDWEAHAGGELIADYRNYTWTPKKEKDPNYTDRYFPTFPNPVDSFRSLWQSINGLESWDQNPWVWVVEFEKIDKP